MSVKIIDNFLPKEEFNKLQNIIIGNNFDWYYNPSIDYEDKLNINFQFIHFFYNNNWRGSNFNLIEPILNIIKPFSLVRIKANLLTKTNDIIVNEFHKDFKNINNLTTGIFYINNCNGYTLFKDDTKVESIANRFVSFDSQLEHTGTSCTDENTRVVINFNYFKQISK
tara:strand:- start:51 stop:554 length:504 start_codon:yes stop_codon:yes gene_type:complete